MGELKYLREYNIKSILHEQETVQTGKQNAHCWPSRHCTQIWLFRLAL